MPELPAEAVHTALIMNADDMWADSKRGGKVVVQVVADEAAEAIARALAAHAGVGSVKGCPQAAPESTQGPETPYAAPVYPPAPENPGETLSALRCEPVDLDAARRRIERAHTELGEVCAQGPSRRFKMHIPADPERDTDLIISAALNDADLLVGEVGRLRADLARALRIADYHAGQHRQAEESIADLNDLISQERAIHEETIRRAEQADARIARVRALRDYLDTATGDTETGALLLKVARNLNDILDGTGAAHEAPSEAQRVHLQAADILARLFPAVECVLIDHAGELDDEQGRVDANLAELAHVYRELTGFNARTAVSEEHTGHACGICGGINPDSCMNAPTPPASTTEETNPHA